MRKIMMLFVLLIAVGLMISMGCVTKEREIIRTEQQAAPPVVEKQVVVQPAPPPLRVEVKPPPPAPQYVWEEGYWQWTGRDYEWVPGHWRRP
jgi:hypothetical protein